MASDSPSLKPLRFSSPTTKPIPVKSSDFLMGVKLRRSSVQSNSRSSEKGKNPIRGKDSVDSATSADSGYNTSFAAHYNTSTSFTSYESHSPLHTADRPKKPRGSLLVAASDALTLKFGLKRKPLQPLVVPVILPDVIEISAPRRDEEVEERERLRDAAAQSIGLDPVLLHDALSKEEESLEEQDAESANPDGQDIEVRTSEHVTTSPVNSVHSMPILQPLGSRHRPGSALSHSRNHSIIPTYIPPFPTTPSVLTPSIHTCSALPKYYPPSSLRIFALSKHWKSRFMILSSPAAFRGSGPAVSYLHLFKSSGAEERELERLEINEDSVVFVSEEDVGGRKNVIKVGGVDVGALKKELNHEEGGRTMWLLQIIDPSEAQQWIASIKNAILGQRTVRAGLGVPAHTLSGIEPRGDMDVMFSMRAQGIIASPTSGNAHAPNLNGSRLLPATPPQTFASLDKVYASSTSSHSLRSQTTSSKPASTSAVSALKGLFTGSTRSRSASRAASLDDSQDPETKKDSLGIMGDHLMSMMRPNATGDAPLSRRATPAQTYVNPSLATGSSDQQLDRRIITERQPVHWTISDVPVNRQNRSYSVGALPLQPPRKRPWISLGPVNNEKSPIYKHSSGNDSVAGNFGIGSSGREGPTIQPPASPTPTVYSSATFEQSARAPSIRSVSTYASNDPNGGGDRSISSAKTKRWSRQGSLPKRLTPPSGPPPSVPGAQSSRLQPPHAGDTPYSEITNTSGPLTFSKRESVSSAVSGLSVSSTSYSHSNNLPTSPPASLHRTSMPPPPRPAPTFAPPPPPDQGGALESTPTTKSSFRESTAHRSFRLSLTSPKPPPSMVLPPRPDEIIPSRPSHRRISTTSSLGQPQDLSPIPASPIHGAPSLPPSGLVPSLSAPASVSRHASLKKRLRLSSAPPSPSIPSDPSARTQPTTMTIYLPPTPSFSPPATPIGERIITLQNDPSFLSITPITPLPSPKVLRCLPTPPHQLGSLEPALSPLSPPPRRGSRQLERELEISEDYLEDQPSVVEGENKLLSLSRRGSVISLGIVHVDI